MIFAVPNPALLLLDVYKRQAKYRGQANIGSTDKISVNQIDDKLAKSGALDRSAPNQAQMASSAIAPATEPLAS